jgi:uncharacterized membrane protein
MRLSSLLMGIALIIIAFIFGRAGASEVLSTLGYVFGGILILMGLFLPSRREMFEKMRQRKAAKQSNEDPSTILKRRYASGEITKEQYDKMKKDIT